VYALVSSFNEHVVTAHCNAATYSLAVAFVVYHALLALQLVGDRCISLALVTGTMLFGESTDYATAEWLLDTCLEASVNFFDTAEMYDAAFDATHQQHSQPSAHSGSWLLQVPCPPAFRNIWALRAVLRALDEG